MVTPTKRTMDDCRRRGWIVDRTEHWNHHASIRVDLFGWCDVIALTPSAIVGIQATTSDNFSARLQKIQKQRQENVARWLKAGGRAQLWGWRQHKKADKSGRYWRPRVLEITEELLGSS